MIRLSGLVNLQALAEENNTPNTSDASLSAEPKTSSDETSHIAAKLNTLKGMKLSPDQEQKVDEMLAKVQELTGNQKKLDADGDGKLTGKDFAALRGEEPVTEYDNDRLIYGKDFDDDENDYDARRDAWAMRSDKPYRSPYDRGSRASKPVVPAKTQGTHKFGTVPPAPKTPSPATSGETKDTMLQQKIKYKDADGKEHEATVKSLLGYAKEHPGRKAAARVYAQFMSKQKTSEVAMVSEGEDHEVAMAQNLLDDIIKNATELKQKLGTDEKDIPAWIQDHISQSQNFISQANTNYHEHDTADNVPSPEETPRELNEAAPEGWEKTIKAMKKKKEIDNPWALANWMKKKGYTPKRIDETERKTAAQRFRNRPGIKGAISNLEKAVEKNKAASSDATPSKDGDTTAKQDSPWGRDPSSPKPPAPWPGRTKPSADSSTVKVKNPETGEEILATTAIKDKNHPAHNAAVAALKKT
jgi:hypothetical protein